MCEQKVGRENGKYRLWWAKKKGKKAGCSLPEAYAEGKGEDSFRVLTNGEGGRKAGKGTCPWEYHPRKRSKVAATKTTRAGVQSLARKEEKKTQERNRAPDFDCFSTAEADGKKGPRRSRSGRRGTLIFQRRKARKGKRNKLLSYCGPQNRGQRSSPEQDGRSCCVLHKGEGGGRGKISGNHLKKKR